MGTYFVKVFFSITFDNIIVMVTFWLIVYYTIVRWIIIVLLIVIFVSLLIINISTIIFGLQLVYGYTFCGIFFLLSLIISLSILTSYWIDDTFSFKELVYSFLSLSLLLCWKKIYSCLPCYQEVLFLET